MITNSSMFPVRHRRPFTEPSLSCQRHLEQDAREYPLINIPRSQQAPRRSKISSSPAESKTMLPG